MNIKDYVLKRAAMGISSIQIADLMGCTRQTINNLESGRSCSKMSIKYYISTIDDLWKNIPDEEKEIRLRITKDCIDYNISIQHKLMVFLKE